VGSYLRVVVTGIGDFGGTVISPPTKKVDPLRTGGVNDPGYTLDLSTVPLGGLPAGWVVDNNATVGVATTPDGEKAVKVVNSEDFVLDIPFGPQRSVFDISYSLYVETNGEYPKYNERFYSTKLSFLDSQGETVAWNQPMTWGDVNGDFYWNGAGGYFGIVTENKKTDSYLIFNDNATAGQCFTFVYSFDFTQGTYTITVNGEPIYSSPSLGNDTFTIPPASSEIASIRLEDGLPDGSNNNLSKSVYYYKDIVVGDGGLVDVPKKAEKIYNYKNYHTGKLIINEPSVSITLDEESVIKNGIKPKKAGAIIDFKNTTVGKVIIDGTNVAEIRGAGDLEFEFIKGANKDKIKFID
jgi:hypothetical protein